MKECCGKVLYGEVLRTGVVVVWLCFCGGVVVFLWLCFCGGAVAFLWWCGVVLE